MAAGTMQRQRLTFRNVNRLGDPGYDAALQRHHLLPRALARQRCFSAMLAGPDGGDLDLDDFRRNGLLLPCHDDAALRLGLPLHRGPHGQYNDMVGERLGQIERTWSQARRRFPASAGQAVTMRVGLLQTALRRRLLAPLRQPLRLCRFDPVETAGRFADLDGMADLLWRSSDMDAD